MGSFSEWPFPPASGGVTQVLVFKELVGGAERRRWVRFAESWMFSRIIQRIIRARRLRRVGQFESGATPPSAVRRPHTRITRRVFREAR